MCGCLRKDKCIWSIIFNAARRDHIHEQLKQSDPLRSNLIPLKTYQQFCLLFFANGLLLFFPAPPRKNKIYLQKETTNKKQTNKHVECSRCFSCLKLVFPKIIRFSPTFWWRFVTSGSPWDAECWGSPGNLKLEGVSNEPWKETLVV